jgi:hypothetical protein
MDHGRVCLPNLTLSYFEGLPNQVSCIRSALRFDTSGLPRPFSVWHAVSKLLPSSCSSLPHREGRGGIGRRYRYHFADIAVLWGDTGRTDTDTDTDTWFSGEKSKSCWPKAGQSKCPAVLNEGGTDCIPLQQPIQAAAFPFVHSSHPERPRQDIAVRTFHLPHPPSWIRVS